MERSGFPEQATIELREIFISYGLGSGISRDTMASFINESHVLEAAEGSILYTFGRGAGYSFEDYSNEIYTGLREYVLSQGLDITEEMEVGLLDLADLCAESLKNHLDSPVFNVLASSQRYINFLYFCIIAIAVLSVIAVVIIPAVNRRVTRWIDGYIYALGATTILCAAIPIAFFSSGISSRLQISPMSYNMLISSWLDGIASGYITALIPLISLIIICVIVRLLRSKKRKKQRVYHEYTKRGGR